jgi:integrase
MNRAESRRHDTQPLFPPEPIETISLRLFSGEEGQAPMARGDSGGAFSPSWTLREFIEARVIPQEKPAPKTIRRWCDSLVHWERSTGNPSIERISQDTCERFLRGLQAAAICNNTRRTHITQIKGFLSRLSQPTEKRPEAVGFFQKRLLMKAPALELIMGEKKHMSLQEIGTYLEFCCYAGGPRDVQMTCQNLTIFTYNTALRIGTVLALEYAWLDRDEDWHWLNIPSSAMKRGMRSGRGLRIPVNRFALDAIERQRTLTGATELIFGGTDKYQQFDRARTRILKMSGIIKPAKRFGFHGLRQASVFYMYDINSRVADLLLGHATGNTTARYYTAWEVLAKAIAQLPQPRWNPIAPQKLLF